MQGNASFRVFFVKAKCKQGAGWSTGHSPREMESVACLTKNALTGQFGYPLFAAKQVGATINELESSHFEWTINWKGASVFQIRMIIIGSLLIPVLECLQFISFGIFVAESINWRIVGELHLVA